MNMQSTAFMAEKIVIFQEFREAFSRKPIPCLTFELEERILRKLKKRLKDEQLAKDVWKDIVAELWPKKPELEKPMLTGDIVLTVHGESSKGNQGKVKGFTSRFAVRGVRKDAAWWNAFFLQRWQVPRRMENAQRSEYAAVWHGLLKARVQEEVADRQLEHRRRAAVWRSYFADYWAEQEKQRRKEYVAFWKSVLQQQDALKRSLRTKVVEDVGIAYQGEFTKPVAAAPLEVPKEKVPKPISTSKPEVKGIKLKDTWHKSTRNRRLVLAKMAEIQSFDQAPSPRKRAPRQAKKKEIAYTQKWVKDFMAGRCADAQGMAYTEYLLELMPPQVIVELLHKQLTIRDFRAWARREAVTGFFMIPDNLLQSKRRETSAKAMQKHTVAHPKTKEPVNRYAKPKVRTPQERPTKVRLEAAAQAVAKPLETQQLPETAPAAETKSATMQMAALAQNAKASRAEIFD